MNSGGCANSSLDLVQTLLSISETIIFFSLLHLPYFSLDSFNMHL